MTNAMPNDNANAVSNKDIRIAAFDIGTKNFAYYVEDFSSETIKKLRRVYYRLPRMYRRRVKGPMNPYIERMIRVLSLDGRRVVTEDEQGFGVVNLRHHEDHDEIDFETRMNLYDFLASKEALWDSCSIILIEQQFFNTFGCGNRKGAGTGANVKAIKFGECCLMWFLDKYWPFKEIVVFGAAFKTQTLGAPNDLTKPQRKKWAIAKGTEIMKMRGDTSAIEYASALKTKGKRKQKLDDMYDTVVMTQAFKFIKLIVG